MQLRTDVDRIEILDKVIDMMKDALPEHNFKILIDNIGWMQLVDRDPPGFLWDSKDGNRYKDYPIAVNGSINGVWIQIL